MKLLKDRKNMASDKHFSSESSRALCSANSSFPLTPALCLEELENHSPISWHWKRFLRRSAGWQPAVSPIVNRQTPSQASQQDITFGCGSAALSFCHLTS
jgi:hypothetical protein